MLVALLLLASIVQVNAWWADGHLLVAQLAHDELNETAEGRAVSGRRKNIDSRFRHRGTRRCRLL